MNRTNETRTHGGNSFPQAEETFSFNDVEENADHPHFRCTAGGKRDSGRDNKTHILHAGKTIEEKKNQVDIQQQALPLALEVTAQQDRMITWCWCD